MDPQNLGPYIYRQLLTATYAKYKYLAAYMNLNKPIISKSIFKYVIGL